MINQNKIAEKQSNFNQRANSENKIEQNNPFENKIIFKYLSGYPLIQYNLAKVLFHKLSIGKIIKIFLFIFLEKDVIFFSEDVEYLTLTINAFINFNFPLNDSEYFYNVGPNSLYSFQMNEGFGIKINSSIIAINYRYIQNYLSRLSNIKEHVVVDLDYGEIRGEDFQDDSYDTINKIIENICRKKGINNNFEETKLFQAINNLYNKLTELSQKKGIYFIKNLLILVMNLIKIVLMNSINQYKKHFMNVSLFYLYIFMKIF
jgi:hypothetical protein